MMMLLKQLIESPITSSKLVVCDPFREPDQEELVKEVIGLANAAVDGPRNILFGINAGALDGGGIVGIAESAMAELKKAHRELSALIEPVLHLAFIFDRINGKLVGALEIDGCDDRPYIIGKNFSENLSRGQCWIREGRDLRAVQPADVSKPSEPIPVEKPTVSAKPPRLIVGLNEEPDCVLLEMSIPDASEPPFATEETQVNKANDLKKTIREKIGTVTTRILRLGGASKREPAAESEDSESDEAQTVLSDANNHYYFEEKALKLNICICNKGSERVENVSIKLGFPRLPDFDVVDRLYVSPFDKRSAQEIRNLGYPQVEHRDRGVFVRSSIDLLTPDSPKQAFKCDLRLAVGPRMRRKKVAILYTLYGPDKQRIGKGRLKIKFGNVRA